MAYRIKLAERPSQALRRILREQTELCLANLARESSDIVTGVHEARKSLKRARALLRLMRSGLAKDVFKSADARYRGIARLLGGQRDAHVLLATLDLIEAEHGSGDDRHFALVRLAAETRGMPRTSSDIETLLAKARRLLAEARGQIDELAVQPDSFRTIGKGLEQTLRACRAAFETAVTSDDAASWHEWRKTVQQHWRQMRLLERAWPEHFKARDALASELAEALGRMHDLAMLQTFLRSTSCAAVAGDLRHKLYDLAEESIARRRELARPLGKRLLAESPKGLRRRARTYWRSAQELRRIRAGATAEGKVRDKPPAK